MSIASVHFVGGERFQDDSKGTHGLRDSGHFCLKTPRIMFWKKTGSFSRSRTFACWVSAFFAIVVASDHRVVRYCVHRTRCALVALRILALVTPPPFCLVAPSQPFFDSNRRKSCNGHGDFASNTLELLCTCLVLSLAVATLYKTTCALNIYCQVLCSTVREVSFFEVIFR